MSLWAGVLLLLAVEHPPVETATAAEGAEVLTDAQKIAQLQEDVERLSARLDQAEAASESKTSILRFSGYVDFGFFVPTGNGTGVVEDFGGVHLPELKDRWVFLGDLLAPAVNSRGEPADLGDLPGVDRFDGINSNGAPGFILNEVNFTLDATFFSQLILTASLNAVPRSGKEFSLGDFIELDLAQLEWLPTEDQKTSVFVGKIEPSFGIEYKVRKANRRFGITPSLIARYTSGTQLGIKARSRLFNDWLLVAAALTNGSAGIESFHFHDEIDSNAGKTFSSRAALRLPLRDWSELFASALHLGVSVEVGAQDHARDSAGVLWLVGADLEYEGADLLVRAQWVRGASPGRPEDRTYALDLRTGFFFEVDYWVISGLGVLGRVELRDATVRLGDERLYRTQVWRLTGGVRIPFNEFLVLKVEYLLNGEFGDVPQIADDVVTSSLVVSY